MRLFTTSPCHVTKIGNKTANINAKKHSLSHQLTAQLRIENSKNKKMVIKLLQQSTFRQYAAIVLSPFFYFCCFRCVTVPLTGGINYVFCIYCQYGSVLTNPTLLRYCQYACKAIPNHSSQSSASQELSVLLGAMLICLICFIIKMCVNFVHKNH